MKAMSVRWVKSADQHAEASNGMDANGAGSTQQRKTRLVPVRRRGSPLGPGWHKVAVSTTRVKVHKVLHCRNSAGCRNAVKAPTWNRDCNASRNLVMLTVCEMEGLQRPTAFLPQRQCPGADLSTRAKQPAAHAAS